MALRRARRLLRRRGAAQRGPGVPARLPAERRERPAALHHHLPGWYPGRAVHIHFKVRTSPGAASGLEFTSQLFFDEALADVVHAQSPYSRKGRRDTLITTDGIFRSGGTRLLVPLAPAGGGYAGTMYVGVRA